MNPVLYWNSVLLEASRRDHSQGYGNGQQSGPTATSRAMAIVHLAIHDAIAFKNKPGAAYLKKKNRPTIPAPAGTQLEDAIDGAAITALKAMYPKYHDYFDESLGAVNPLGFNFGVAVANAVLAERAADGHDAASPPAAPTQYGTHRVDPYTPSQGLLGAHWGQVTHFVGPRVLLDDFPGKAHQPTEDFLNDNAYRADYEEVRDFGALPRGSRSAEQSLIGVYWGYDGAQGIGVPPRLYNQIARKVITNLSLSVARTAELFAQINVAMADGGIDAWFYKYNQNLWRPVVGIRAEDAPDGDCFWAPLGAPQTNLAVGRPRTPPFPAYPSGHATFGAALFQTLRLLLTPGVAPMTVADVLAVESGTGASIAGETFDFVSDELDGRAGDPDGSVRARINRKFTSFDQCVWENSVSRIYLGVHWRFDGIPRNAADNIGGVPLGLEIGRQVHAFFSKAPSLGGP